MKLVTEQALRAEIGHKEIGRYTVDRGVLVTPSARQYLSDRKIELVVRDDPPREAPPGELPGDPAPPRFIGPDGGAFAEKPEHMTHLRGNRLVPKGHPRIAFRGKLDSMQSKILEVQCRAVETGCPEAAEELQEVLECVREILGAEVAGRELAETGFWGLSLDEIRAMSHHPGTFFGVGHLRPHHSMGALAVGINALRSEIREVELAAFRAFVASEGTVDRPDILRALNRISSALYVLLYRHLPKGYDRQP